MGMADVHAAHRAFVANLTNICHVTHLLKTDDRLPYTIQVILAQNKVLWQEIFTESKRAGRFVAQALPLQPRT